ncbi:MAG: M16 family metallopeptidase [Pseudomonadota bacterium]
MSQRSSLFRPSPKGYRHSGAARNAPNPESISRRHGFRVPPLRGGSGTTAVISCLLFAIAAGGPARARLDLANASVERLDNGLTLILLEERTFPVVSIQTVYKTGAKDDPAGRLGLAHFFEHMAFRGSKSFPDTGLVSEIYAVGGEWHGYTWLDLTTYFATAPKENLPLLLDIEADRMARLELRAEDVEAERGAVLAEMNGYANDPDSTLFDALIATHFLTHPYRNNTIGYAGDVKATRYQDIAAFYARHYAPQNAVIAIVGDFDSGEVRKAIEKKFARIRKSISPRDPLTAEAPRTGERRVRLSLPSDEKLFKIAYPAPAASSEDFPAFLILQALVGESGGVNFNQNDWGTPVGDASPLASAAGIVRSWIIPTAEPYAFVISGSTSAKADEGKIERRVQQALDFVGERPASPPHFAAAREKVLAALAFDVDTTEEAAHQLAYFAGVGALDQLMTLEKDVKSTTAKKVAEIARTYLRADQRTIAWLSPGAAPAAILTQTAAAPRERQGSARDPSPAPSPRVFEMKNGEQVLFQRSALSPTVALKAVLDGRFECSACAIDDPAPGMTSISASAMSAQAETVFAGVADAISEAKETTLSAPSSDDPMTRLEEVFSSFASSEERKAAPFIIAVSGDIDRQTAESLAERRLGELFSAHPGESRDPGAGSPSGDPPKEKMDPGFRRDERGDDAHDIDVVIAQPKAQTAVGYVLAAPAAGDKAALAMQIALYVLSHGYEGRLGKEAISRQGLAYYIDAQYRAGPKGGLVTLAAGVDPEKLNAFRDTMKAEIARLSAEPPSDAEIAEARRHLIGRKISAAQSNEEIADALIRDFLAVGRPESADELAARLAKVAREDVLNAAEALQNGAVVTVRVGSVE